MSTKQSTNKISVDKNMDGGYGWVIVGICCFCQALVDGMIGSYGILYPELLDYFSSPAAVIALPGSLIVGSLLLMGFVSSGLTNMFGCRVVTFLGAVIAALGFVLAFLVQDIYMFIICYGVLGGCGIGIMYLPSMLMVNTYFQRKRGIAQGIVSSGSGVGMMAIAPLLEYLLYNYGWRGTVLLCAGLFLQVCVLSQFMRPFQKSDTNNESSLNTVKQIIKDDIPNLESALDSKETALNINSMSINNIHSSQFLKGTLKGQKDSKKLLLSQRKLDHESTYSLPLNTDCTLLDKHNPYLSMQCVHNPKSPIPRKLTRDSDRNMLQRKDIFFSASTSFLTKYESRCSMRNKYKKEEAEHFSDVSITGSEPKIYLSENHLAKMCKPYVLKNKAFILLSLGCILTQMAQFIPMVFMADYSLQIGLQRSDVSVIFIAFGITNTFGRLFAGGLTSFCRCLSALSVCNVGIAGCAGICFLFPFCTSYGTLAAFMTIFGFFIGFFAPTQPLITLEYVGLDNLTSAFGLITFFKSPAAIAGPPLAGGLYQLTKNYSYSIVAAGALFSLNCLLQCLIPCVGKPYLQRENSGSRDIEIKS